MAKNIAKSRFNFKQGSKMETDQTLGFLYEMATVQQCLSMLCLNISVFV